jgi:hypothetical protein
MKDLGIEMLGLSLNDLVSEYINETNSTIMRNKIFNHYLILIFQTSSPE